MATGSAGTGGTVYPVGLRLLDRRVVVVGGGQVAHRRVPALLDGRRAGVTVVSPEVTPALEALVAPGSLTWVRRRYEHGDLDGAWYAVVAPTTRRRTPRSPPRPRRARIFCARADDRARLQRLDPGHRPARRRRRAACTAAATRSRSAPSATPSSRG